MKLALIDVDGTLLRGPSAETLFMRFLLRQRVLGVRQLAAGLIFSIRWTPRYGRHVRKKNKAYLTGLELDKIKCLADVFVTQELILRVRSEVVARIVDHQKRGEGIALLTGTPDFIAAPLARTLHIKHWCATQCANDGERFLAAPPLSHPFAQDKVTIAAALCRDFGIELKDCVAYADSCYDLALFEEVGTAIAVAPDKRLENQAHERGWEILTQSN